MADVIIINGDDTDFLDKVLLIFYFKTNLNLDGYKCKITIENPTDFIRLYEVQNNTVEIVLDKTITSTLEVGEHRCSIKLLDTLNRVKTLYNFIIKVNDSLDISDNIKSEYEFEIILDKEGISKYKNYDELLNKPSINGVVLEKDKTFDEIGITQHINELSNIEIEKHNTDIKSHKDIRDELMNKQNRLIAGSNITIIDGIISSLGSQGGVTTDYKELGNKPKINNVVLDGILTLDELNIQEKGEYITEEKLLQKGYLTSIPSGYITEEELQAEQFLKTVPDTYFTDEQNELKYATKEELGTKQSLLTAGDNINIVNDEELNTSTISAIIPEEYITETELSEYDFVTNEKLTSKLKEKQNTILAGDNIKMTLNSDGTYTISAIDSKSTTVINSYNSLVNKPILNGVTLIGSKTLSDFGIQPIGDYQNKLTAGNNIQIENDVITAIIPDDICTDLELFEAMNTKADKADSLEGYNIADAYTKNEVDNNIINSINDKLTDCIISAPNGIASYTENTLTAKSGLTILFSNGLLSGYNSYNNIKLTLEQDKILDLSTMKYEDKYKEFYLILTYDNSEFNLNIISKSDFKIINTEIVPNYLSGIIKNINDNKYYKMVYVDNGIYNPINSYIKIIAEGTAIPLEDGNLQISSLMPYSVYRILNMDEMLQYTKDFQHKINFGENFIINDNNLDFQIPYNYVTKEYLIENDFATQTNINDAVNIHNTNSLSHSDIRDEIELIKSNYTTKADMNNRISQLTSKINSLDERISHLEDLLN